MCTSPLAGHADLGHVRERAPRPDRRRRVHIDVVEDHQRRVAAKLEVHSLEVLTGERAESLTGATRAREGDHSYGWIDDEGFTHVGATGQHVQQSVGEAGLGEDLGDDDTTADPSSWIRLEHHAVAEGEGGRDRTIRRVVDTLNGAMTPTTPNGTRLAMLIRGSCERRSMSRPSACDPPTPGAQRME